MLMRRLLLRSRLDVRLYATTVCFFQIVCVLAVLFSFHNQQHPEELSDFRNWLGRATEAREYPPENQNGEAESAHTNITILNLQRWHPESLPAIPEEARVIFVAHEHWMGVRAATEIMGLPVALRDDATGPRWDEAFMLFLKNWKIGKVVISGLPPGTLQLAESLHAGGVQVTCIYHGSFTQHHQNGPEIAAFSDILNGSARGIFSKVGLVKHGDIATARRLSMTIAPVSNMAVPQDWLYGPQFSSLDGKVHIGVLGGTSLRKNVITQLVAACSFPNVVVHVLTQDLQIPYLSHCQAEIRQHLPRANTFFQRLLSQMDLNLYVSLSECQPMIALESISAGVPCIISDTSTIYDHAPDRDLLVCKEPDSADAIRNCIGRVLGLLGPQLSERLRRNIAEVNTEAARLFGELVSVPPYLLFGERSELQLSWLPTVEGIPEPVNLSPSFPTAPSAEELMKKAEGSCSSALRGRTVVLITYELAGATPGGAGVVIHSIAESLWRMGAAVILLADMTESSAMQYLAEQRAAGAPPDRFDVIMAQSLAEETLEDNEFISKAKRWALAIERLAAQRHIDMIEFFEYAGPASVLLARRQRGESSLPEHVKVAVRIHGSLEFIDVAEQAPFVSQREVMYRMERFCLHTADAVFAPSEQVAQLYMTQTHITPRRIMLAPPPVEASLASLQSRPGICNPNFRHPKGGNSEAQELSKHVRFLILGRIQRIKNPSLVVQAAVSLLVRHPDLPVSFTFAGPNNPSGPHLPDPITELRGLIPEMHASRFNFTGSVPRALYPSFACNYDVGIIASMFESFNMVAHELTYLGLPLIISDFVAFSEYFNQNNAFVYQRGNISSLAQAMLHAIKGLSSRHIGPLKYPSHIAPYRCLLSSDANSTDKQRATWWQSEDASSARHILEKLPL